MLTHHQIPLLLVKSALHCWMYPTAQITLSLTPSHPWLPPVQSDHTVSKLSADAGSLWNTVKQASRLQTSSHPQNSACHLLGLREPQQKLISFEKKELPCFQYWIQIFDTRCICSYKAWRPVRSAFTILFWYEWEYASWPKTTNCIYRKLFVRIISCWFECTKSILVP